MRPRDFIASLVSVSRLFRCGVSGFLSLMSSAALVAVILLSFVFLAVAIYGVVVGDALPSATI